MIKIHLIKAILNLILLPLCSKLMKAGKGPIANQKVLNFYVPNRGRRLGGQPIQDKTPKFLHFILMASLRHIFTGFVEY